MERLHSYLNSRRQLINEALTDLIPEGEGSDAVLKAMRYSLLAGGKRLRGILMLAAAEACGGRAEAIMHSACAIEMLHTYSLIHDDLPAMDDDDFRRGQPTCHKVYGEAVAILAGDALLTKAFEMFCRQADYGTAAGVVLRVMKEICIAAGVEGMIGGQALDLAAENQPVNLHALEAIHAWKTGALFKAALRAGAILVGTEAENLTALTSYGEHFGLAFQITDDILDMTGESDKLGKTVGSDIRKAKATYPGLYGIDGASEKAREHVNLAVREAGKLGENAWPLIDLARYLLIRQN